MEYSSKSAFEEQAIREEDLDVRGKLYSLISPHKWMIFTSIMLSLLVTGFTLALPYSTKIAIDKYIVPHHSSNVGKDNKINKSEKRFLSIPLNKKNKEIISKYQNLFEIKEEMARVPYDSLNKIKSSDLKILRQESINGLTLLTLVLLFLIILNFTFTFLQTIMMEKIGQTIMHDLRINLYRHIQNLPVEFFNKNPVARLVTRVTNDIQNMHEMFTSVLTFIFKDLFILSGIIIILVALNWKLALACFTVIPMVIYTTSSFSKKLRKIFRVIRVKIAEINTKFSESISGMKIIQLFSMEEKSKKDFEKINYENYIASMKEVTYFALFMPIMEILSALTLAIVIYYGGHKVISNQLTLGALVVFISYMKMFFRPVRDIAEKYNITQNALASAERIFMILANKTNLPEAANNQLAHEKIKKIVFDKVNFEYIKDETVLKDISFQLNSGNSMALVGSTGSGKTTVINLLARFYDPISGKILLNDKEINEYNIKDLRGKMALVMQDPFIFSGTIRNNIIHGNPDMSDEELEKVLVASNCKSLIEKLPRGIDTELSEGGSSISSGERQLISIARAFASNPELIILDEATSYIDSESELQIQEALNNLIENRTSIIIAHRLSTARGADNILVLKSGAVAESGTHEELMDRKGIYYKLNLVEG